MELKPGYRQTEVGVIPEDWDIRTLGFLTTLLTNGFVGTATSAYVESDDGVLYIQGYNVIENGFNFRGIKRVSESFHLRNKKSNLQAGDMLTIQTGDIGVTAVVPPELAGSNCHALIISRFKKGGAAPRFYCHHFNSDRGRAAFKGIETGTTMKHLNCGDMKQLLLPSPPVEEQHAIASALDDADALLSGLDKLIAKKRDLKQATMQQLLTGQTRLPGFSETWEVRRFGQLANIRSGGTPSTGIDRFWDGDIPWCTPTDITQLNGSKYLSNTSRTITQEGLLNSSAELIPANSVVMTSRATIGECAINLVPVSTNQGFKNFVPFASTNVEFFYYLLLMQKQGFIRLCAGSTFLEIGKAQLASYEVHLPSTKEEQAAIAVVLSDMDAELSALESRREKIRVLKQGMMQELLTGKTRLQILEAEAAPEC